MRHTVASLFFTLGAAAALATSPTTTTLKLVSTSRVVSDPINQTTTPRLVPGSIVEFTLRVENVSAASPEPDTVHLGSPVPKGLSLFVGKAEEPPFRFADGMPPSSLKYRYAGPGDKADGVSFSHNGGATYDYVPQPDAVGFDPAITHFRVRLDGTMAPAASKPTSFQLSYKVRIN